MLGNMIHKAGAGPKPIPHKELSVHKLRDAITFAVSPAAKEAAKSMAQRIYEDVRRLAVREIFSSDLTLGVIRTAFGKESRASISIFRC